MARFVCGAVEDGELTPAEVSRISGNGRIWSSRADALTDSSAVSVHST